MKQHFTSLAVCDGAALSILIGRNALPRTHAQRFWAHIKVRLVVLQKFLFAESYNALDRSSSALCLLRARPGRAGVYANNTGTPGVPGEYPTEQHPRPDLQQQRQPHGPLH